jgi:hypothetical protein
MQSIPQTDETASMNIHAAGKLLPVDAARHLENVANELK